MDTGALKTRPFQVRTSPLLSTMTQNVAEAQDTALSCPCVSTSPGWVQVLPFQTDGPPSAATQKVGDTHEIWLAAPQAPRLPGPAAAVEAERIALAVDGDAEGRTRAIDGRDALSRRTIVAGGSPRGPVEHGDLVQTRRGGAEGRRCHTTGTTTP